MIVDTGPLVAAANDDDPDSDACRTLLRREPGTLIVPALVVAEAGYLIERDLGPAAEAAFVRSLATSRYRVEAVEPSDLAEAARLIDRYASLPLGVTDATVMSLALRTGENRIATLDRRHFTVVMEVGQVQLLP